jgi:uncharacterized protein YjlB
MQEAEARALESSFLNMSVDEEEDKPNDMMVAVAVIDTSQWPTKVVKTNNLSVSMHHESWTQSLSLHYYETENHKANCPTKGQPTIVVGNNDGFWVAECGCGNLRVYALDVIRHWLRAIDRFVDSPHITPDNANRIADQSAEIRREWLVQWRTSVFAQKPPAGLLPILVQRFPDLEEELNAV